MADNREDFASTSSARFAALERDIRRDMQRDLIFDTGRAVLILSAGLTVLAIVTTVLIHMQHLLTTLSTALT